MRRILLAALLLCSCERIDPEFLTGTQGSAVPLEVSPHFRHRGIYYQTSPMYQCREWFALMYEEGVVPEAPNFDAMKAVNPLFKGYTYKSATDTYTALKDGLTPHPDGVRYAQIATSQGVDPESMYLHWADTTTVTWWIGSEGPQPYTYLPGSRVEMYGGGHQNAGYRHLHSFLPATRRVHELFHQEAAARCPGVYCFDGLFLDNCGSILYSWGDPLLSGGTVREAGLKINSLAFRSWYWTNLRDYLSMLTADTRELIAINCSNSWTDDYLDYDVADRLVQEFVGNPIRDSFPPIGELARRHEKAAMHGIGIWTSAAPTLSGETWEEMQYATLCLFLVTDGGFSSTHIQDITGPYRPDWPARIVSPAESQAAAQLGFPREKAWRAFSGTNEFGHHYEVWRRAFENGVAYARILEPWNGSTMETFWLPKPRDYSYIDPLGAITEPARIGIKNGGGAILIFNPAPPLSDDRDPVAQPPESHK